MHLCEPFFVLSLGAWVSCCVLQIFELFFFGVVGSHMIVVAVCRFLRFVLSLCSV